MSMRNYSYDEPEPTEAERLFPPGWWIGGLSLLIAVWTIGFVIGRWTA